MKRDGLTLKPGDRMWLLYYDEWGSPDPILPSPVRVKGTSKTEVIVVSSDDRQSRVPVTAVHASGPAPRRADSGAVDLRPVDDVEDEQRWQLYWDGFSEDERDTLRRRAGEWIDDLLRTSPRALSPRPSDPEELRGWWQVRRVAVDDLMRVAGQREWACREAARGRANHPDGWLLLDAADECRRPCET